MDAGIAVLVVLAAFAPPIGWTWFFYHRDRYEREPRRLIASLFLRGVFIAVPVALIVNGVLSAVIGLAALIILAGVTEEPIKFWTMSRKARRDKNLSEPVDGIIYGTTVGLGFAAAETVFYIIDALAGEVAAVNVGLGIDPFVSAFGITAPLRALTSALMHAFCSGLVGFYFARHVLAGTFRWRRMLGPLGLAAILHGGYNALATISFLLAIPALIVIGLIYVLTFRRALGASPHRKDEIGVREQAEPESHST